MKKLPDTLHGIFMKHMERFGNVKHHIATDLMADSRFQESLPRVFSISDFVASACTRHPDMLEDLLISGDLYTRYTPGDIHRRVHLPGRKFEDENALAHFLASIRRREWVRIAWRDLAGWAELDETMSDLSGVADAIINEAVHVLYKMHGNIYGTPTGPGGSQLSGIAQGVHVHGAAEPPGHVDRAGVIHLDAMSAVQGAASH